MSLGTQNILLYEYSLDTHVGSLSFLKSNSEKQFLGHWHLKNCEIRICSCARHWTQHVGWDLESTWAAYHRGFRSFRFLWASRIPTPPPFTASLIRYGEWSGSCESAGRKSSMSLWRWWMRLLTMSFKCGRPRRLRHSWQATKRYFVFTTPSSTFLEVFC